YWTPTAVPYLTPTSQPIASPLRYRWDFYGSATNHGWLQSILNVQSAVCLNEIVNAPGEFVSSVPHLVVDKLDWIQTRYLFVKVANGIDTQTPTASLGDNLEYLQQDIRFAPRAGLGNTL